MAGKRKDRVERAMRKVAKAQLALQVAQEKHQLALTRGKQEVEKARLQAAEWLTEAAEQVERRSAAVSKAESKVRALTGDDLSPEAAADRVEEAHDAHASSEAPAVITMTEAHADSTPPPLGASALRRRELQALEVLQTRFEDGGASAQEWREAAGIAESTFQRARKTLLEAGLVRTDGGSGRKTRYLAAVNDPVSANSSNS